MIDTLENGLLHQLDHVSSDSPRFVLQYRTYSRILNNRVDVIGIHPRNARLSEYNGRARPDQSRMLLLIGVNTRKRQLCVAGHHR